MQWDGMKERFLLGACVFHAVYGAACVWVGRRWHARRAGTRAAWIRGGAADAAWLAAVAFLGAGLAALVGPPSGFTLFRYLAQGLFGETIVLAAVLAWSHSGSTLRARSALLGTAALGLLAVYVEAYHREPTDLQVRRHPAVLPSAGPKPRPLRIVHISDLQTDTIGPFQERAMRQALAESPDLIVFTGDYIQPRLGGRRAPAREEFQALLRRLDFRAPLGVFAVRGDVDPDWPQTFEGTNVAALTGEAVRLPLGDGRFLSLVGLTSGMSRGNEREPMRRLIERTPAEDVRIVFGHQPDYVIPLAGQTRIDLALAGHTHGGQVALPFFGPPYTSSPLPRRYAGDLHDYRGTLLHVSRGVGMERGPAPQIRFLVPPEICVLDLLV
jgi:predicted MPP superfamily phosphohydrolase